LLLRILLQIGRYFVTYVKVSISRLGVQYCSSHFLTLKRACSTKIFTFLQKNQPSLTLHSVALFAPDAPIVDVVAVPDSLDLILAIPVDSNPIAEVSFTSIAVI